MKIITPIMAMLITLGCGSTLANQAMPTTKQLREQRERVVSLGEESNNSDLQRLQQMTQWTQYDQAQSTAWDMTKDEWLEYKQLMAYGPMATYYRSKPEVTPLIVMGINAKSEEERRDYARRAVDIERARITKEIAFDEAWNSYIKELTPNHPIWMSETDRRKFFKAQAGMGNTSSAISKSRVTDTRVVVYVDATDCDSKCQSFIARYAQRSSSLMRLDLFVLGADDADELLSFGEKVGITEGKLDARAATINRDNGSYSQIQPAPGLPVAYRVTTAGTFKVRP